MYKMLNSQNSEFLIELSEEQQETFTAGENLNPLGESNIILQKSNMETTSENVLNLKNGDKSFQKTKYILSQLNVGISLKFTSTHSFSLSENSQNNFIAKLLNNLAL